MFGISMWELGLIVLVALILLGPRQLTETARVLGRLYREVTKMTNDLRGSIDLDSMTTGPSSPPRVDARPLQDETAHPSANDMDMLTPSREKSGPDFYAELLESSKEDDGEKESEGSAAGDEPQKPAGEGSEVREKDKDSKGKEED